MIEPDEHLLMEFRGQAHQLGLRLDIEKYVGRIPFDGVVGADEEFRLIYDRGSEGTVTIAGTAPSPLTLTVPVTIPDTENILVTWSPTAVEPLRWWADSPFLPAYGPVRDDHGEITFPPGVLAPLSVSGGGASVTVTVARSRRTISESAFQVSRVTVEQWSRATFTVTEW